MLPDERGMLGADERIVLLDEDERIVLLDEDERLGVATRWLVLLVRLVPRTFVLP